MSENQKKPTNADRRSCPVGRVPPPGVPSGPPSDVGNSVRITPPDVGPVGRVPPPGVSCVPPSGIPIPPPAAVPHAPPPDAPPRRLRRLHRLWPDRDGNISYLLTLCVDGRSHVLDNEVTFQRLVGFLLESPLRYQWFGHRFVVMPDHIHLIAHQGHNALRLGEWIKALKAVVGGLQPRQNGAVTPVGRPASAGSPGVPSAATVHERARLKRAWRWQSGFHDHKFRTRESEARKWEYVCLNPVRYKLVARPEQWSYGGEIFYDPVGGPHLVRGTPPLLESRLFIEEEETPEQDEGTPGGPARAGRPTT
jgi:REP element-mobilizing transposase RayT